MKARAALEQLWLRMLPRLTRDYLWASVDGFRIYGSTSHQLMLYWLLKGSYERYTRKLFVQALEPGGRALDVGAHIGYYTLLAGRAVGSSGRVYAFECDPANYRFLRHNVALNGMKDRVRAVPKAAAESAGVRPFFAQTANSLQSSLWNDGTGARRIAVETVAVDEVVGGEPIDVVKIDVEGAEVHALRGMRKTIERAERLALFVECNPGALAAAGVSVAELLDELASLGLDVEVIREKERRLEPATDELTDPTLVSRNYYVNLRCTKRVSEATKPRPQKAA
jgi:FkbM family methyltransferase